MAPDNISMEEMAKHPRCTVEGFLSPPYLDVPLSFVYQKDRSDVHIFLNDLSHPQYLCYVADNFRHVNFRRVEQPVMVFHDKARRKFRLCPMPPGVSSDTSTYGRFCFARDATGVDNVPVPSVLLTLDNGLTHSLSKNAWILYRKTKEPDIRRQRPEISHVQLCEAITQMWLSEAPEVRERWKLMAQRALVHYIEKRQEAANNEASSGSMGEEPSD
ncbi:HMG box domain-containing protein [Fusarium keratoplasticum]|nr:HMG box domain-containing protein [Fusarium keratoplasticum]